ncbi:MAG: alpha/beta hydrolase-fold protein [Acidimicrobiia bacterium]|nr:alpha/beta hydrolase-fold protein [Acidimicrobiia bacterium]
MIRLPEPWPANPWVTRFRTVRSSDPTHLAPGLRFLTIQSPALAGRGDVAVHLTPHVDVPVDVPVVIMLHGVYGSFWNWPLAGGAHLTLDRLVHAGRMQPMVLVTPSDGLRGEGTAYLPHPDADYEAWIMDDVVDAVTEFIAPVTTDSPLLLGGNSMGAFGAARLGTRHSSRVAGIAMHSAITHLDQLAQFTVGDIGTDAGIDGADRDLVRHFAATGDATPPVFIDCGRDDFLAKANDELHRTLEHLGIRHQYEIFDGAHDWDAWSTRIQHSLLFFESVLRQSQ